MSGEQVDERAEVLAVLHETAQTLLALAERLQRIAEG